MNEDVSEEIAEFMERWRLKRGQRFIVPTLPGYLWYIDSFDCLFCSKPEWDGFKMVEEAAWFKRIAISVIWVAPYEEKEGLL